MFPSGIKPRPGEELVAVQEDGLFVVQNAYEGTYDFFATSQLLSPAENIPAPTSGNRKSFEEFEAICLEVISDASGYPKDMLDQDLPLESGLGIDSIKLVDILARIEHRGEARIEATRVFASGLPKTIRELVSAFWASQDRGADSPGLTGSYVTAEEVAKWKQINEAFSDIASPTAPTRLGR